jgi:hypothetical protein
MSDRFRARSSNPWAFDCSSSANEPPLSKVTIAVSRNAAQTFIAESPFI